MMEFDFNTKIADLIESIEEADLKKLRDNQDAINEIAEYCRTTKLYQYFEKERNEYSKDIGAVECYQQMIIKIVEAPGQIIARGAVILLMPIIADKLNRT